SKGIRIGEALAGAKGSPVAALIAELDAFQLVTGKVLDVERRTTSGFVRGSVVIEGLREDAGRLIRLELQNENLVALERGRVLASVPDLITVLDSETADAIATETLRYGQRVTVIAFACDPVWRTERGIAVAGPRAFDYDFDYQPVEELARASACAPPRHRRRRHQHRCGDHGSRRPGRRQGQGAVHARYHRRNHQGDRHRPAHAGRGPAADQPRHAGHHPRDQRGAGAPEPAAG